VYVRRQNVVAGRQALICAPNCSHSKEYAYLHAFFYLNLTAVTMWPTYRTKIIWNKHKNTKFLVSYFVIYNLKAIRLIRLELAGHVAGAI
jgi:hypothetical protein